MAEREGEGGGREEEGEGERVGMGEGQRESEPISEPASRARLEQLLIVALQHVARFALLPR